MRSVMLVASLWLVTSPLWGKIAFYSKRDGNSEIYTMDSNGSRQTRLTFNAARDNAPSWAPNGRQIAFHSSRHDDNNPHTDEENTEIYVMDADGSNVKQITRFEFATNPQWSPDGKQILFEGDIDQGRQIYAIRSDGRGLWRVSEPKPNTGMLLGGWSPDGKKVVYVETVGFQSDQSVAVIATLHPAGRQQVVKREPLRLPRWDMTSETWSIDGESLLFAGRNRAVPLRKDGNNWEIYRFRLQDGQITQLTNHPQDDLGPHDWDPRLSVSPQRLAPKRWGEIKSNSHK